MNLAVRLVSGGGVGLADAVGLGVDGVKLLSPFLHPVTKSGNTDRNTNKQRRIQTRRKYTTVGGIVRRRLINRGLPIQRRSDETSVCATGENRRGDCQPCKGN